MSEFAAVVLLLVFGAARRPMMEWKESEIWLTREGEPALQLTRDGCEKGREPASSPDGTKIAYYVNSTVDKPQCPTEVVLLAADGTRLMTIPALDRGNAVMGIHWLGNDRIGIDTHVDSSVGQYLVVSVTTGEELASHFGNRFQPSPDSKHIAHAGSVPHFAPPFAQSAYLMIDDTVIYPHPPDKEPNVRSPDSIHGVLFRDIHDFRTDFAWSPDGTRVAFIERVFDWRADNFGSYDGREENDRWRLVVVPSAGGAPVQKRLSQVGGGAVTVQWTKSGRIKIAGGGLSGEYTVVE